VHTTITSFGRIASNAIDTPFVCIADAGDIQEVLIFKLHIKLFAQEEAQCVLGTLGGSIAIAEINLIAYA
jgi:hypothetical protein